MMITQTDPLKERSVLPNGWRYPLVGGTRQRHFDGTYSKPQKLPENAQTPTSRVHAVLASIFDEDKHNPPTHLILLITNQKY